MKILISDAFDASLPAKLERFGEITEDKGRLAEVDVVLVRSKTKCRREYIDEAANLKLIVRGGVGLDNIDVEYARSKGVRVYNTASASAIAVAEMAFALMLAVPTRLCEAHLSMREGRWAKKELKRTELFGKTLGLIGAGNIGTEVGRRAAAFGMQVLAYDPLVKSHEIAKLVPLTELFEQADYLSIHVPLTNDTKGMINRETIAAMKDGVVIVNTARGQCVVEEDLAEALASGKVRGYGTDVWYSDPPDQSCPLLTAPNVVMSPHIGASSVENMQRIGEVVVKILEDFEQQIA
ncbi:MAG: hydroxyacid dehydrogenase [Acidobacteria bacterium]|nr:hydroxyacid dehydrogenase [Acidobacteriota bacterium]